MKEYYKILGVPETASDEQIREAYYRLKGKYMEDRWQDGEAGNEAAKMLNKLETAYNEIRASREQKAQNTEGQSAFEKVSACLKNGDLSEAQRLLDDFNERSAEWHYLQAVVFYKKNWENESRKQLEIAMQMDPTNVKYREEYNKLKAKTDYKNTENPYNKQGDRQNPYSSEPQGQHGSYEDPQMGGNACSECISCCYTYLCVDCLFSLCCGCR
ncbi:MAG: J domain-containing protein [Clostridia bacterium]|nr:J domain-containing protein [Clostridia bacterium]MBQ7370263.1 J domain-containing protein [Clostridia bacterium]